MNSAGPWRPIAVVPGEGTLADALRGAGVTTIILRLGVLRHRAEARSPILLLRLATAVFASVRLGRVIRRYDAAVVHSNTAGVIAGAIAAHRAGLPHIWHLRELLDGPSWPLLRRAMFRYSTLILCITEAVADHLMAGDPRPGSVLVIRDGIDLDLFHPAEARPDTAEVLMLGRIHPNKGQATFIRAAALVADRIPNATFTVVGECLPVYMNLRRSLEADIERLGLGGRATLVPGVSREEAARRLREAAVAVVPSVAEPGGLVVFEAMASGVPVIASDIAGPPEVVRHDVNGLLFGPDDVGRLAELMELLLTDRRVHERIAAGGLRYARENFDADVHVHTLRTLYDRVSPPAGDRPAHESSTGVVARGLAIVLRRLGRGSEIDSRIPRGYWLDTASSRASWLLRGFLIGRPGAYIGPKVRIRPRRGVRVARGATIAEGCRIDGYGRIGVHLQERSRLGAYSRVAVTSHRTRLGSGFIMGRDSGCGEYCYFGSAGGITIGNDVIMGQFVSFHSQNHVHSDASTPIRLQGTTEQGIRIGNDCWIGAKATFLDGADVGDGCVVAAGAVVRGTFQGGSVIAGVPGRVIASRLDARRAGVNPPDQDETC